MINLAISIEDIIKKIDNIVWGIPLIALIIIVGIVLTILLKGIQFRKLGLAFKFLTEKEDGEGEVSTFQALCISLSATIGTGNITGVATAVAIGGPGALFWMIVTALLGMATKYAEGYLAIRYRHIEDGRIIGGPYAYIEYGMGKKFKWLAKVFAMLGMLAAIMGIGTLIQINGITDAAANVFGKSSLDFTLFGKDISIYSVITGLIIAVLTALILIGGVKRIGRVCEYLVPIMAITYITICLTVIFTHVTSIPSAFVEIVKMAFTGRAAVAGVIGITNRDAIKKGVSKGIFTNEAGLGSAPIAIATAKSNDATKQGLISMTSTFMGTVIICMMTGLCIVITGAWDAGLEGIDITSFAFETGLPFTNPIISAILVFICITCFAFTTIIGWNLYGSKCLDYFTKGNKKAYLVYQWIYVITLLLGPFLKVDVIWGIANIFNGLMAAPNLIALLVLAPKLSKETNQYFVEYKEKNKMVSE